MVKEQLATPWSWPPWPCAWVNTIPCWLPLQTVLPQLPSSHVCTLANHFTLPWNTVHGTSLFQQHFFERGFHPTITNLSGVLVTSADYRRFLHTHWFSISRSNTQGSAFYQSAQHILMHIQAWEVFHRKIHTSLKRTLYAVVPCYLSCLILGHMSPLWFMLQ